LVVVEPSVTSEEKGTNESDSLVVVKPSVVVDGGEKRAQKS